MDPEKMLIALRHGCTERKLRLFAIACCRRLWDRLVDERSRRAVEMIEQHVEARATDAHFQAAVVDAERALRFVREQALASIVGCELAQRACQSPRGLFDLTDSQTALAAHDQAERDGTVLAASAVYAATSVEADFARPDFTILHSAINTANQTSDSATDQEPEKAAQAILIRDVFGTLFRPMAVDPSWLAWSDETVVHLAQAIYEEQDFDRMSILGDALEDAGCHDESILRHCREKGIHVRGCWLLDLLLNKE